MKPLTRMRLAHAKESLEDKRQRRKKRKAHTVKERMEQETYERDKYFKQALLDLDTKPFMKTWLARSKVSMSQILSFVARSMGTVEGFEFANRALRENLEMSDASVDMQQVIDFSKKAARISFFQFVMDKNNISKQWRDMAMTMFIAKEFHAEKDTAQELMTQTLKRIAQNTEGPYPQNNISRPATRPTKRQRRPLKEIDNARNQQRAIPADPKSPDPQA